MLEVLLVSAQSSDGAELQRIMARFSSRVYVRTTWQEGLAFLRRYAVPVVICDAELEVTNWRELLTRAGDLPEPPCLIVSSRLADERLWAEVLNLGGYDVLYTPFNTDEVLRVSSLAAEFWRREHARAPVLTAAP